jgi:hypothetical protein
MAKLVKQWSPEMRLTYFETEIAALRKVNEDLQNKLSTEQHYSKKIFEELQTFRAAELAKSREIFPFEKLPAELRVQIYRNILVHAGPVYLTFIVAGLAATAAGKAILQGKADPRSRVKRTPLLPVHGTAILRLNKLTYAEALPILYSENTFFFESDRSVGSLVKMATQGAPLVNEITFDHRTDRGAFDVPENSPQGVSELEASPLGLVWPGPWKQPLVSPG